MTATDTATTTTWAIDPKHSTVEFSVRHMMVSTVRGRFGAVRGTLVLDEADITRSSVTAEIDVASITTGDEQRDGHVRSPDFFDVAAYPTITFVGTGIQRVDDERLRITGDLTIRGVTRPVTLAATYNGRGPSPFGFEVSGFSAEGSISRGDFGLNWNVALEAGGVLVSDTVRLHLEVEAIKQG
jgi:polyisoprenoid-binding protein YceI